MSSTYPLSKRIKKQLKKLETSPIIMGICGLLIYCYSQLVGITTRWQKIRIDDTYKVWEENNNIILIIWHGRALLPCYFWKNKKKFPMSALVSPHRDGRLIASVLKLFGIKIIDGSSNENANGAALSLMRELQNNRSITIIPDGPKGPNMKLSRSALYFAQKTGKPIIGMTYSVKGSKLVTRSWDKMMLPPLFSKGIAATTEPFYIPGNINEEEFEQYRLKIERSMRELTWQIDKDLGLPKVEAGFTIKEKKYK